MLRSQTSMTGRQRSLSMLFPRRQAAYGVVVAIVALMALLTIVPIGLSVWYSPITWVNGPGFSLHAYLLDGRLHWWYSGREAASADEAPWRLDFAINNSLDVRPLAHSYYGSELGPSVDIVSYAGMTGTSIRHDDATVVQGYTSEAQGAAAATVAGILLGWMTKIAVRMVGVHRQMRVQCGNCRYDLRATPDPAGPLLDRCPECGATTPPDLVAGPAAADDGANGAGKSQAAST